MYQTVGTPGVFQAVIDFDTRSRCETVSDSLYQDAMDPALAAKAREVFSEDSMRTSRYVGV